MLNPQEENKVPQRKNFFNLLQKKNSSRIVESEREEVCDDGWENLLWSFPGETFGRH